MRCGPAGAAAGNRIAWGAAPGTAVGAWTGAATAARPGRLIRMVFFAEGFGGRLMRTVAFFFCVTEGSAVGGTSDIAIC